VIVDTNILLRLIDGPASPQHERTVGIVRAAQDADETLVVTDATFLEVGFVLRAQGAGYGWEVGDIAKVLTDLLETVPFTFERAGVLRSAVVIYGAKGFDLHDCYLQARALDVGAHVMSLDGDFDRM
jgi:predicted nucleic acid-binding protein